MPTLTDYIRIPNKSPAFDADWAAHGHMDAAVALIEAWAAARARQALPGATLEVVRLPGRTPLIFIDIPPGAGRRHGAALRPSRQAAGDDRLGRGARAVDAGARGRQALRPRRRRRRLRDVRLRSPRSLALQEQGVPHARCVVLIEACEESRQLRPARTTSITCAARIGTPSLVVCLDSGCGNYDQLWLTTSLRGIAAGTLTRRGAERRRPFRRRLGHRAVELPHPAPAAVAARGRGDRAILPKRALRSTPESASSKRRSRRRC